MPYGSKIIKKAIKSHQKNDGSKKTETPLTPLKKIIMPDTKKDTHHTKDVLTRFKNFVVSPEGIVTVIIILILSHYAWKGYKADGGKAK